MTIYSRPDSLEAVLEELEEDGAALLAGGVSLVPELSHRLAHPRKIVSLRNVADLRGIRRSNGRIEIGALTTHAQVASSRLLVESLPGIRDAFGRIGNVRVREWATVGGNLALAAAAHDPPVYLSAVQAVITVRTRSSERTIPVVDLCTGVTSLAQNELITTVVVPTASEQLRAAHLRFLPRSRYDTPTVTAAAALMRDGSGQIASPRLMVGLAGTRTVSCAEAVRPLDRQSVIDPEVMATVVSRVRSLLAPPSDSRGSTDYKRHVAGVFAARAIRACFEDERGPT